MEPSLYYVSKKIGWVSTVIYADKVGSKKAKNKLT
jgi:hypothetical protein